MRRIKGWTLVEATVVLFLSSLLVLVLAWLIESTMQASRRSLQSAHLQQQALIMLQQLEADLARVSPTGWAWRSASGAGSLGLHCVEAGPYLAAPRWQPQWTYYGWSQNQLWRRLCPPGVGAAPPTDRSQPPTPLQLEEMRLFRGDGERLLANNLVDFVFSRQTGGCVRIELELLGGAEGRRKPLRLKFNRTLFLRNNL